MTNINTNTGNGVFEFVGAGYYGGIGCGFGEYFAGEPIIITIIHDNKQ